MAKQAAEARGERLARARALVEAGAYLETAGAVYVYSDRPGIPGYTVERGECPCPDATVGYAAVWLGRRCKHAEVARLVEERHTNTQEKR